MNRRAFNFGLLAVAGAIAFRRRAFASQPQLRVNGARIVEHLNALAEFGKNPQGGVSRLAYSEADREGPEARQTFAISNEFSHHEAVILS